MCVCVQKREKYIATIVKIILMGKHELNVLETLKSTHAFQHMTIKSFTKRVETIQPEKLEKNQGKNIFGANRRQDSSI